LKSYNTKPLVPALYLLKYSGTVENALDVQNGVAQGLFCYYD
jgi:hypothetical protein